MKIWVDAQLSPAIAAWINRNFQYVEAFSVAALGLRDATDLEIFNGAAAENAVIMSKDSDFVTLVKRNGMPPQIIWITTGNSSHKNLCEILKEALPRAIQLLEDGEPIVEISQ